jgi:hypothetical protein
VRSFHLANANVKAVSNTIKTIVKTKGTPASTGFVSESVRRHAKGKLVRPSISTYIGFRIHSPDPANLLGTAHRYRVKGEIQIEA